MRVTLVDVLAQHLDEMDEESRFALADVIRSPKKPRDLSEPRRYRASISLSIDSFALRRLREMAKEVSERLTRRYGYEVRVSIGTVIAWLVHAHDSVSPKTKTKKRGKPRASKKGSRKP